jgi:hypothetical protein
MILNQGINKIRDLHYTDMDNGVVGTAGDVVVATQTALIGIVTATEVALTKTQSDKSNSTEYKLLSTVGVGNTYREYSSRNASDLAFNRYVFTGIEHTSADEIIIKNVWFYSEG